MLAQVDENGLRDESDEVGGLEVGVLMMVEHVEMQDRRILAPDDDSPGSKPADQDGVELVELKPSLAPPPFSSGPE